MNQQALMKKLKQLQDEMVETQREIEATLFTASAGGVVTIEMLGNKKLVKVDIDPSFEAHNSDDFEMLSDMIVAACQIAIDDIDKFTEEKKRKYQSMLGYGGF